MNPAGAKALKLYQLAQGALKASNYSVSTRALQQCLGSTSNLKLQARALFTMGRVNTLQEEQDSDMAALCFLSAAQRDPGIAAAANQNMYLCLAKVVPLATLFSAINDRAAAGLLVASAARAIGRWRAAAAAGALEQARAKAVAKAKKKAKKKKGKGKGGGGGGTSV